MAIQAAQTGGSMPVVFNAANEAAVGLFLEEKIRFLDIYELIGEAMAAHTLIPEPSLEEILEVEAQVRSRIVFGQ